MPKSDAPLSDLRRHDILWITSRLPRNVRDLMKTHGQAVILAGGFIRACIANEKPADIDLFTTSKDYAAAIARELAGGDLKKIHTTDNAYTVNSGRGLPIQIIHRWTFPEPESVVCSFDFTIASAAVWCTPLKGVDALGKETVRPQWHGKADAEFYSDLAGRRIVYRCPIRAEDAGGSMLRVLKFYQRGYRIPLDSLGEIIARLLAGVDPNKMAPWERNEEGMARVITGLLREVDPLTDPDHIAHLPSEATPTQEETPDAPTGSDPA